MLVVDFEVRRRSSRNTERSLRIATRIDVEVVSVVLLDILEVIGRNKTTSLVRTVLRRHDRNK